LWFNKKKKKKGNECKKENGMGQFRRGNEKRGKWEMEIIE
jgi:hypothetical protein